MEKCKYTNFYFLSDKYGEDPKKDVIIDKMIQAINEVPTNDYYIELLAKSLSEVICLRGIKWSNLQAFSWDLVNKPYCFRLYMHYAMLMAKDNMRANKHILVDALYRFGHREYGDDGDNIRKLSKWNYYFRQYIRLYGLFDENIHMLMS